MSALLLLLLCLALGAAVARFGKPPATLAQSLNWWVLHIALPALVLHLIPPLELDWHLWFLPASMWFVFTGAWAFFAVVGRRLHWSRQQIGALILVCGLGNTSFVGYPMIDMLRGQNGLALAVVADQCGSFLMLAIGGALVCAVYSGDALEPRKILRRLALSPALLAFIAGLIAGALGGWPAEINTILQRIGSTLVPLALFSVGLQLQLRLAPGQMSAAAIGLTWKLVIAAMLVFSAGRLFGIDSAIADIAVLQAAMAPMISAAILANQHDLDPPLANTVLGIGILTGFVSVPLASFLLQ